MPCITEDFYPQPALFCPQFGAGQGAGLSCPGSSVVAESGTENGSVEEDD